MFGIREETLKRLREEYPQGCRVELVQMDDPYNTRLVPGCKGTVVSVDDAGTIHVRWDCGSSLGVVYGEDSCKRLDSVKVTCYGEEKVNRLKEFFTDREQVFITAYGDSNGDKPMLNYANHGVLIK